MKKIESPTIIDKQIVGNTFQVYSYLYSRGRESVGVREVQRALGFNSPSSAIFQLEKLRERNLIEKQQNGEYILLKRQKIGNLRNFILVGGIFIPWLLVSALVISLLTMAFLVVFIRFATLEVILAILPSIAASIALWVEAHRIWKYRPLFSKKKLIK